MPGRRPSGVRPVYAACPVSPVSPASSGGRGAVGKVFSRLNPFSVFLPLWAGRGCPGGDARTTFPYFGSRKHPVLPGRVQSRRPVRVLPRRRTAEGACSYRRPVCSAGLPSGRADADISSEEEAVFRRAGRRAEVCPIVSKKERRRPVRAVFSCRFLLRTQPAEHGPGGWLPPPEAAAARPEERRSENRRMLEECRFWRLRVLSGRAVQRPAIRKTSDVRRGVGCGGEGAIAGRTARKRRNSLYRPVGTDGRASQLENRRPPILLRESAGEAPVRWW